MQAVSKTPVAAIPAEKVEKKSKKRFMRRLTPDHSQRTRRTVQGLFLGLNVWIAIEFVIWVSLFEGQGRARFIERPAGVDGWLPIAGLMNLKYFLVTHQAPQIHPSAMVLAAVFLL